MKRFQCKQCQVLVSLENDVCTSCGSRLVFVPELGDMAVWGLRDEPPTAEQPLGSAGETYRLCQNYLQHNTCNWAVRVSDGNALCVSCRLTTVIPDLTLPENLPRWYRLEGAKRRLLVGLMRLQLQVRNHPQDPPPPLAFQFLADVPNAPSPSVLTGHQQGVITINVAEADDDERERRRVQMHEPYRTLVGHFRHESGHFYWDRLIKPSRRLAAFRTLFGDERADYAQALARHYEQGPPADWQRSFVSSYASTHPWEDWAETWAHYLHMVDSLDTAFESGLSLKPRGRSGPSFMPRPGFSATRPGSFSRMIDGWFALTYVLNDLNRGLGLQDAYPFVLSDQAIAKLEFVHNTVQRKRARVVKEA